jgi:S1-C subfamily serine protease
MADKTGIKGIHQSLHGDIITALDGIPIIPIKNAPDLLSYIDNNKSPGEKITVTIYRNDHTSNLIAALGKAYFSIHLATHHITNTIVLVLGQL